MSRGRHLTVAQVARHLHVPARTVRDWCEKGKVPGAVQRGGASSWWQIPPQALPALRAELIRDLRGKLELLEGSV